MSADDVLFDQVGAELTKRPGWRYEPSTTPGGPPSWCLDPAGEILLSVSVYEGSILLYVPSEDWEVPIDNLEGLLRWVDAKGGSGDQPT